MRAESERATLISHPGSFVEPIHLLNLFPKRQPIEVELGSGDGAFISAYAKKHPDRNFVAVERLLGRMRKLDRKARRTGLRDNLRLFRLEGSYFLTYLIPPRSIHALHIYFPDPWPKRRHNRRRMINRSFAVLAAEKLVPGGMVYLRTDNRDYFHQMIEVFEAGHAFRPRATPLSLAAIETEFEHDFRKQGFPTLRIAYQKHR